MALRKDDCRVSSLCRTPADKLHLHLRSLQAGDKYSDIYARHISTTLHKPVHIAHRQANTAYS